MRDGDDLLDLDQMGDPEGSAAVVPPDVLDSGHDRPDLTEHAREWRQGMLLPYLHGHPAGSLLACLVLLMGVGATTYWRTRPPAVDPVVRVGFAPVPAPNDRGRLMVQNLYQIGAEALAADYLVTVQVPGDVVDVMSIHGPGLRSSAASAGLARHGSESKVTLAATFDCDQRDWWTAVPGDYLVNVTRTDRFGRLVEAAVPLAADDATAWREVVQRQCLVAVLAAMNFSDWNVAVDRSSSAVRLSVRVVNPADHPVYLQFNFWGGLTATGPPVVAVPAHGSALLTTGWPASSCPEYPSSLLGLLGPADPTNVILLRTGVVPFGPPRTQDHVDPDQNAVDIPHSLRVHLQYELDEGCAAARSAD